MIENGNLVIKNARITLKNFSGRQKRYNDEGDRNFAVYLSEEDATFLAGEGWNVRYFSPREGEENGKAFLKIAVAFGKYPPKIVLIDRGKRDILDENTVHRLDSLELEEINLAIRPYPWEVRGQKGIKGYLKTLYARVVVDEFEGLYEEGDE